MSATATMGHRHGAGHDGDWKETLGRLGLVGKGILYSAIGLLAIQLAAGSGGGEQASQQGAIQWIAEQPFGRFLLGLLTAALFALAAWRLLDAVVGDPVEGSEGSDRAKFAVKGIAYLALAIGALTTTLATWSGTASSGSGSGSSQQATATVLEWPFGRWIVAAVGLGVIGYAAYTFKKHAIDQEFLQRIDVGQGSWLDTAGRWGYAARSVVYVVIGWFLLQSGLTYDADQSKGMSAALQEIAGEGWGRWLLWAVAVGLLAFGLFSLGEAKHRRAA